MKLNILLGAALVVLVTEDIATQNLEAFSASEEKAFEAYMTAEQASFDLWKKEQAQMFSRWREEAKRYRSTSLKNIDIDESGDSAAARSDVDFTSDKISVAAIIYAGDSTHAKDNARMLLKKTIRSAIEKNISEESKTIPEEKMNDYIDRTASSANVVMEKRSTGYVAKVSAGTAMTGTSGLMALVTPEKGSGSVIPMKKKEIPVGIPMYTSVVIDARDIGYTTCLIPLIIDIDGRELYGPKIVRKEYAINGMAQWVRDSVAALQTSVAGTLPLFLKADKVAGRRRLLFGSDNTTLLERVAAQSDVLETCRVVIMVK